MAVPCPSSAEIAAEPSKDSESRRVIIVLSVRCSDDGNDRSAMRSGLKPIGYRSENSQPLRAPRLTWVSGLCEAKRRHGMLAAIILKALGG